MRARALSMLLVTTLLLGGCPQAQQTQMGSENIPSEATLAETTPAATAPTKENPAPKLGKVDYRCKTDADCAVKDVGNCCGYFPACVNVDSPTFPKQVKAQCEADGAMSVCGFENIQGCTCVEGRCASVRGNAGDALPVQ